MLLYDSLSRKSESRRENKMYSLNLICVYYIRECNSIYHCRSQIFCSSPQFKWQYLEAKLINITINVLYASAEWKIVISRPNPEILFTMRNTISLLTRGLMGCLRERVHELSWECMKSSWLKSKRVNCQSIFRYDIRIYIWTQVARFISLPLFDLCTPISALYRHPS